MQTNHSLKHFFFKYYALLAAAIFVAGTVSILIFLRNDPTADSKSSNGLKLSALGALALGVATFAFGVQKQQLEELTLFKNLFEGFNERYNELNGKMNHIYPVKEPLEKPFTDDERNDLFDYFNLCGEEYLYFDKGFIYPEVWQSWKKGMEFFRKNPRIKKLWDEELRNGSYYGLTFDDQDMQAASRCDCVDTKHSAGEA